MGSNPTPSASMLFSALGLGGLSAGQATAANAGSGGGGAGAAGTGGTLGASGAAGGNGGAGLESDCPLEFSAAPRSRPRQRQFADAD